jgi:hypothetical protein
MNLPGPLHPTMIRPMRTLLLALALLPLILTGCDLLGGGGGTEPGGNDGGLGDSRPHVLILAVSGHPLTVSSGASTEYLIDQGTVGRAVDLLSSDGSVVWAWDHADAFYSLDVAGNLVTPWDTVEFASYGFLHLLEDLRWVDENWIQGRETPTRLVVLAHSHGAVWAHIALHLYPDVPVDVLVDLDADSKIWGSDTLPGLNSDGWDQVILQFTEATNAEWAFEIWQAADYWTVEDSDDLHDIEEIVPASVALNLEVRSDGLILFDDGPNLRLDGSNLGVSTFETNDGHEEVAWAYSEAMDWVLEELALYYGIE